MDKPRTLPVVVHKAAVPLLKGESLNQFTCAVNDAAAVFIKQKYNLPTGDCDSYVWCHEVYADKAVCSVSNYKAETQKERHFYVAVKFTRRDSGEFDITDSLKVRPVTSFVADKEMSVSKGMKSDAGVKEKHDPKASAAVLQKGLRMLSGHAVEVSVSMASGSDMDVKKAYNMDNWSPVESVFKGLV